MPVKLPQGSISRAELSIESVQSGQIPNAQHGSCPENEL